MSRSKKPALRGIATRIATFLSRMSAGLPWYDVHLPLIPVAVRNDRPALPPRPMRVVHQQRWRAEAESPRIAAMVKRAEPFRGVS